MKPGNAAHNETPNPFALTPERRAELREIHAGCNHKRRAMKSLAEAYAQVCNVSYTNDPFSGVLDVDPLTMGILRAAAEEYWKLAPRAEAPTTEEALKFLENAVEYCNEHLDRRERSTDPKMQNRMELLILKNDRKFFSGPQDKAEFATFEIRDIAPVFGLDDSRIRHILKAISEESETYWSDRLKGVQFVSRIEGKRRETCYTIEIFDLLCDYEEYRKILRMATPPNREPRSTEEMLETWDFWKERKNKYEENVEWMESVDLPFVPDSPDR